MSVTVTLSFFPCFLIYSGIFRILSPLYHDLYIISVCVQKVSLGDDVTLLALPYADLEGLDPSLSFKWKRSARLSGKENELEFKASSHSHFKGFISCEISKNQKHFFTVYHCLKESVGENNVRACMQIIIMTLLRVYCTCII